MIDPEILLHIGDAGRGRLWAELLPRLVPDLDVRQAPDIGDPAHVHYVAAWTLPPGLVRSLHHVRFVLSIGAGVDQLDLAEIPPALPLLRMAETAITAGMVEYAVMGVLALHRDMPHYLAAQRNDQWLPRKRIAAGDRRIGVMGLGMLGRAVLAGLAPFGFPLRGWSRSQKALTGVQCYAGDDGLPAFLAETDILVCLLPLTPATSGMLDTALFSRLPQGAALLHLGRGAHLVADDLIAALDRGVLSAAMLDVVDPEPLPIGHPLWRHPAVLLTPHIASSTDPVTAAHFVADAIMRARRGEPLPGLVDRTKGY